MKTAYLEWALRQEAFSPDMIGKFANEHEEISDLFDKTLASKQRGAPEMAMGAIQKLDLAQVYGWLCEHVGDLTHRMAQKPTFFEGGYEWVSEKVRKTARSLNNFADVRDLVGQIERNIEYRKEKRPGEPGPQTFDEAVALLQPRARKYADEHRKLPTYNRVQFLAKRAAVRLGEIDFYDHETNVRYVLDFLEALNIELRDPENWKRVSMIVENAPR